MLIGAENTQIKQIKSERKISSAQQHYQYLREQDKLKDNQNIYKINFNQNYNTPIIQQYTEKINPGPNQYKPNFNKILNKTGYDQTFARGKKKDMISSSDTPSVFQYDNNCQTRISYDEKRAVMFSRNKRFRNSSVSTPGVGQYDTNKQYNLSKGKGVIIPKNHIDISEKRVSTPGVGSYLINKNLRPKHGSFQFGHQDRFGIDSISGNSNKKFKIPGVGSYKIQRSLLSTSNYGDKVKYGNFTTESRFQKRIKNSENLDPGPLNYKVQGYFDQLSKNKIKNELFHKKKNCPIYV